ncbi:MAG: hypothetical protein IT438_15905 [Phycisphaerales bacterium]|nr:hypothetical protein [Phycisphaerales bacterium]
MTIGADAQFTSSTIPSGVIVLDPDVAGDDQAPYYKRSSALLGGGAVGLVPFRIHEQDCEPMHRVRESTPPELNSTNVIPSAAFATLDAKPGKVRFYGPILVDAGVNTNLIEMGLVSPTPNGACGRDWIGASSMLRVTGPGSSATGIARRTLSIGRNPNASAVHIGEYRVRVPAKHASGTAPPGTRVTYWRVCTGDLDEPLSEAYFFRVAEGSSVSCETCLADFNCSGMISVQDIFDFLTSYFSNCDEAGYPQPVSTPCFLGADVNDSGAVSVQDIFDFLAAYFSGC